MTSNSSIIEPDFKGLKKRESRGHTLDTVGVENAQQSFCGEIKGAK